MSDVSKKFTPNSTARLIVASDSLSETPVQPSGLPSSEMAPPNSQQPNPISLILQPVLPNARAAMSGNRVTDLPAVGKRRSGVSETSPAGQGKRAERDEQDLARVEQHQPFESRVHEPVAVQADAEHVDAEPR